MNKCGTMPGYFRHRRAGETPCRSCKDGFAEYARGKKRRYTYTCVDCGEQGESGSKTQERCRPCVSRRNGAKCTESPAWREAAERRKKPLPNCRVCGEVVPKRGWMCCSDECRAKVNSGQKSALRVAYESGDRQAFYHEIRTRCSVENECWIWGGTLRDGYAYIKLAKKRVAVYRMVLEVKLGAPLGKQAAHHACANSACVNPDHLEPVTAAANMAEMLARKYMESRIADLESALAAIAPNHDLLREVGVVAQ